ncbi:nickel pincer cofactor biosynthesis protein LarC [Nocardioides aurantiacus]|uniref:nickel pincer cofactor biosynthesis protein LarC n=1 Tax=Nocardioides aurantiacus TaxID=86796 RepID=UPI00403F55B5
MSGAPVLWVDASSGASGDMLLGALAGLGVPVGVMAEAVDKVAPGQVELHAEDVRRAGFAATRCHVEVADDQPHRTWRDVERLLAGAGLHEDVRALAHDVFSRLAEAEGAVHGCDPADVHFHEVGALDAIADVVGVCAGVVHLGGHDGLPRVVVSAVALGGGTVRSAHGTLGVPPPAVVELLRGVPSYGSPVDLELCTPTGAALLTTLADAWGPQPPMAVDHVGVGAGGRDPEGHANALRVLVGHGVPTGPTGETDGAGGDGATAPYLLETNVDDLDPRLWPGVISALLEAGASDAWLTPILMKKGRPAHTLAVLVPAARVDGVRREVYRHTSTIGMREQRVGKHALDRAMDEVHVGGQRIAVKVARLDGEVLNAQPEFEDVAAAARALDRPATQVMAEAVALADRLVAGEPGTPPRS